MQEAFLVFITKISLYPTFIFTGLVMFVTLYWVVSLLGMADMDTVEFGESGGDTNITDLPSTGFFTGLMLKFGLYGVPLIIILSLISLIGWLLSYLYTSYLHQNFDSGVLYYVFGTGALIFVLVVSMWLTGIIISPIRKNIARILQRNSANNVGKIAIVRTLSVTDKHGEAELNDGGAGLILKIRSDNNDGLLKKGDRVMLVEYIHESNSYRVASIKDR